MCPAFSPTGTTLWRRVTAGLSQSLMGVAMLMAMLSGAAQAQALTKAETRAVEAAVQRQFDAFARDDAVAAFAAASSATRLQFGSAERFLAIVKGQYQAVYRHRVALFAPARRIDGAVVQTVRLTDAEDRVWEAVYQLVREADEQWHIVGCQLIETKSVST